MRDFPNRLFPLPPEQQAIRDKCFHPSGTFVEFPEEEIETTIPQRFEKVVGMHPNRLAVKIGDRSVTYEALNCIVNHIAEIVVSRCGSTHQTVALFFEDPLAMIAAIFATLKAGKCFVPLDLSYPKERNVFLVKDSSACFLLTDCERDLELSLGEVDRVRVKLELSGLKGSAQVPHCAVAPDAPAFIMYTSGSTGEPKGVVVTHRNVLYDTRAYSNLLHVTPDDRLTLLHSFSFRAMDLHLFGALLNGAALFPLDARRQSGGELARWLAHEGITILHCIPTLWRVFAGDLPGPQATSALRVLHLSGAPVVKGDWELYQQKLPPACLFLHRIGTTETQTVSWCLLDRSFDCQENNLPLGWPPPQRETLLLDDQGDEVATGQVGEIALRNYLSPGYLNRPELTAKKFVRDPRGGEMKIYRTGDLGRITTRWGLFHLGRKDFQLKVRGFRVEPSEIETLLISHVGVKEAVVTGQSDAMGNIRLIAYLVPKGLPPPTDALRRYLANHLPDYAIPSGFVFLDAMPLTPNGKLDRAALPAPGSQRPTLNAPFAPARNFIEETLTKIWTEVLKLDRIGIHDNFFDLGGDSLAASWVISRVVQSFQLELPIKALFDAPTVAQMAEVIDQHQGKSIDNAELTRLLEEIQAMSEEEAQKLLDKKN